MVLFVTFLKFDLVTKINPKKSALNDVWALVHHNLSTFATAHKRTQQRIGNSFLSREINYSTPPRKLEPKHRTPDPFGLNVGFQEPVKIHLAQLNQRVLFFFLRLSNPPYHV